MPIGPYSPCPGGTGQNVKFCCPKLVGELQKIERMLEGKQHQACLNHIEYLEKSNGDKACLLSIKTLLLQSLDRLDEAEATAARFLEKHPDNPIALAESAKVAAVREQGRRAVELVLRALRASDGRLHPRVYQAMDAVSRVLAAQGHFAAARAIALLQFGVHQEDRRAFEFTMHLNAASGVPLLLKEEREIVDCPDDVPWKAEFDEAKSLASEARWPEAAARWAELAERVDHPAVWRNLVTLRLWLADKSGCIEALRKLAALDVPLEDAVEAEALALFLSDDPLGDQQDVLDLRYEVRDVERLEAAFSASPRVSEIRTDLASLAPKDSPPPKALFFVFDRAMPDPESEITLENVSQTLCQALLYGKETDRAARLELSDLVASNLDEVKALVAETASEALDGEPEQEVAGRLSTTRHLLTGNWRLPASFSRDDLRRLANQHVERVLLQTWPQLPLGLFEGKCPQEVAAEETSSVRLLAAILVLDFWIEVDRNRFDLNRLRNQLGLPTLDPIDPEGTNVADLPLARLSRVTAEKLADKPLVRAYRRVMTYGARAAGVKLARAVAERSSLGARSERLTACEIMASIAEDRDQGLKYVDEGRELTTSQGKSCAHWDLLELPFRLERGEMEEATRLFDHLQSRHINEPGVARALTELLVEAGILNPDGTPAVPTEEPTKEDSSLVIPGQSGAKPGELWTPEGQKPSGDKPKLWTPGSQ